MLINCYSKFVLKNTAVIIGFCLLLLALTNYSYAAGPDTITTANDPHYTKGGFFDIHVCNWPDRPLFFLAVFSTTQFKELKKVMVYHPNGRPLGKIRLEKFRILERKNKPTKRVFLTQIKVPKGARPGWYTAKATFKNGQQYTAKDFVILESMQRATNPQPANGSENVPVPKKLSWDPVPGAKHYQVYIKDLWEAKHIYKSKLLGKPFIKLPKGLLTPGGYYSWRIHARDVNENIMLGDFNHGSLSGQLKFSTAP